MLSLFPKYHNRAPDGLSCAAASTRYTSLIFFFFSSRRRHTRLQGDWSSDVCSSDLVVTSIEFVKRTRATFRSAEFGFFGVCVYTRMHTPRFSGQPASAGDFVFIRTASRPILTSCENVGTVIPLLFVPRPGRDNRACNFSRLPQGAHTKSRERKSSAERSTANPEIPPARNSV